MAAAAQVVAAAAVDADEVAAVKLPGADTEPANAYIFAYKENVPATETKAAHTLTKYKCILCTNTFAWSS